MTDSRETDDAQASLEPLMEQAVFGAEVTEFLERDRIGQYLVDRAREDLERAHTLLVDVSPYDPAAIAKLQQDARVANRVRTWLAEAIDSGTAAAAALQQERDEHGT